ncbi:MAG: hypothetical protein ACREDR_34055, partial [Blastocatellia bacterium]
MGYYGLVQSALDENRPLRGGGSHRGVWILAILLISTVASLLFASVSYVVITVIEREPTSPKNLLLWLLVRFYVWAMLSPLVVLMARRFPLRRAPRWRFFSAHFGAALLFYLIHV